jgi:hypothetical protein
LRQPRTARRATILAARLEDDVRGKKTNEPAATGAGKSVDSVAATSELLVAGLLLSQCRAEPDAELADQPAEPNAEEPADVMLVAVPKGWHKIWTGQPAGDGSRDGTHSSRVWTFAWRRSPLAPGVSVRRSRGLSVGEALDFAAAHLAT